ncbi:MAG: amidohydrolase family protein [Planctomycetota bacterium]|jgi:predicted TIM-barrel fold metal-dependent hydrolase
MCLENLRQLRNNYNAVKAALPWFDATVYVDEKPAFPEYAHKICTPFCNDYTEAGNIRRILHTDIEIIKIAEMAAKETDTSFIIESGPRKIIYFIEDLLEVMPAHNNLYLSTYNFSNFRGIEELCRLGLTDRILYGSHMPQYSADISMAPLIMSDLPWEDKCKIAGNNLRRLLKIDEELPEEVKFVPEQAFIIDAHAHTTNPGGNDINSFPTPDLEFSKEEWLSCMDRSCLDKLLVTPMEPLMSRANSSKDTFADFIDAAPDRFFYFEMFHPGRDAEHLKQVAASLSDKNCIGIKIHPVTDKVAADDDSFEPIYHLAAQHKKSIMTHSWEISSYNPLQYLSHPDRFRRFLPVMEDTPFILGHAGGRPSAFAATVKVCKDFPNVMVDLAGDYYDNGLIEALTDALGCERILFGSDVNWFDPRCNLGPVLAAKLGDSQVLKILRTNAENIYGV